MSDLKLRQADLTDAQLLFDLRNHPEVRRQSNNVSEIDFDSHKKWFEAVMLDQSKQVLIAEKCRQPVGMVRFEQKGGAYLMSWAVFPRLHGQGMGKEMLKCAVKSMDNNTLMAEIKYDNLASIKIAEHIGMALVKKTGDVLLYQR